LSQSGLTIRLMRADDDVDAELDLRHRSFGPMDRADREFWRAEVLGCIEGGRQLGVWDDGQLVGAARYYDMRQFWHGRAVPMAGVGGVKVAPEARGRGVGRALMIALLGAMAERGYSLSALYPATAHLYRSLGWEMAGGHYRAEVPGRSLGSLQPPDAQIPVPPDPQGPLPPVPPGPPPVRRTGPADADEVLAVLAAVHAGARDCGPVTLDSASVRRWLASPHLFSYLAPDGFLGYGWHGGTDHEIMVHVLAAGSARTARALWGIIASHASVTHTVHAVVGPDDPIGWLTREPDVRLRLHKRWMLRVLDPAAAISGRGFPAAANARLVLRLADDQLPAGGGLYTFTVSDGEGSLLPGPTKRSAASPAQEPVNLGPRGFAALYAGVPIATLRVAGLAVGGNAGTDAALDAVFLSNPHLLDYF
jgi:GNAT superfamily N-acetyltransferase